MVTKFSTLAPASSIKASQLDANFLAVMPSDNQDPRHCRIVKTPDGWKMETMPAFPDTDAVLCFDSEPHWKSTSELVAELIASGGLLEEIEEQSQPSSDNPITAPGAVAPSALSPGPNGSLFITEADEAKWSAAPPSGTPAWVQVERCDGQRMYVWGTAWAAPA